MNSWASRDHRLFLIPIFAISITQGDLTVFDVEDAVIGESHAVGVAAEVIEHGAVENRTAFSRRPSSSFGVML